MFGAVLNRLATSVRRALSQYAVGANEPELALNFIDNEYITNNSTSTFASAVTHSMSSNSTMVDSDGYIKWAPHNLIPYSEDFSNASWTKGSNVTVTANYAEAPDGTQTADRIVMPDSAQTYIQDAFTKVSGVSYVGAVWARATSGTDSFVLNVDGQSQTKNVTETWQLFTNEITAASSGSALFQLDNSGTMDILFWGAHLYRSDLGGMVDNPDQPASRASYVPTTSSAVYLPRIGHHVYNGSAWANEGLLAESESRTNLLLYSDLSSGVTTNNLTLSSDTTIAPDGTQDAIKITAGSGASSSYVSDTSIVTAGQSYVFSIYAKAGNNSSLRIANQSSSTTGGWFDLSDGTIGTENGAANVSSIEDVGNGWYRCSRYFDSATTGTNEVVFGIQDADGSYSPAANGDYLYLYGAQVELASVVHASSYIPTSGSTVTRAAETFTIPSANLPWPEHNYIGSELVTNGTFDLNTAGWTGILGASLSYVAGSYGTWMRVTEDGVDGSTARAYQTITTEVGKVYGVSIDYLGGTGTGSIYINTSTNFGGAIVQNTNLDSGTNTLEFVATSTTTYVIVGAGPSAGVYNDYDNISVREINPLAVSIAMDGRMTFSDNDDVNEVMQYRWFDTATDRIQAYLTTGGANTGAQTFYQEASDVVDFKATDADHYEVGVLTPFDIASRHGSTFINAATEGVALTVNSTPTELPDLSSTDMRIAYIFMGTIGTFRVWDRDITDDGLVEATNPSLEPSLSLTFEGTGTNSFVVNDWSE